MTNSVKREFINFTTVREEYSTYKLENGLTFYVKSPITRIYTEFDGDKTTHGINSALISGVNMPSKFNTSNLKLLTSDVTDDDITKKLRIVQRKEVVNIYEIEKSFLVLGFHMNMISATDKKYSDDTPALRFNYDTAITVVDKPWVEGSKAKMNLIEKK